MDQMTRAKSLGFSTERLAKIDRFLEEKYVAPGRIPNAQLMIARQGQVVHQSVCGLQDPERNLPATEDTVFRIYSMTKPITSIVLMSLVEEGRIALEDPVAKYIPSWANMSVFSAGDGPYLTKPVSRPMQVVDLMRHTSGLTYGFQNRTNIDAAYRRIQLEYAHQGRSLEGFVEELAKLPLEFSPGDAWNYGVSTDVVGYLIQVVTGKPLSEVFRERIFEPLKMVDTGFHVREDQRHRFAACYEAAPGGKKKLNDDPTTSPFLKAPPMESGGGGLVSTAADYMRFANMLVNGGELDGARIVAPKTLQLMTANHLPGNQDLTQASVSLFSEGTFAGIGFGLGFAVVFDAPKTLMTCSNGEYYWGGAASTAFWVDPVEEVTVVFMTQLMMSSTYPIRRELRSLTYAALMELNG